MKLIAEVSENDTTGKSRTFIFREGGHTFANALRCIISRYPDVIFCGYTIPHPSEADVHFRIQARDCKAIDVLRRGIEELEKVFDHILKTFEGELRSFEAAATAT